jgi:hypothetical protein
MKLKPIHGMDYFRVILSDAYNNGKPIYLNSRPISLEEIAEIPYGDLCKMFDAGLFSEGEVDKN